VFRRLVTRETLLTPWRDILRVYRRLEARGEIRGGRFVGGFSGEQYALPEAVGLLRSVRREEPRGDLVALSGADPLNLVGIVTPKRVLVGKKTFQLSLGERLVRRRGILPHDRDAIVPAAVFRAVEPRRLGGDPLDMPQRDLALQYREVVLLEEPDELVGEAPAGLVVVLDHERLTRSGG